MGKFLSVLCELVIVGLVFALVFLNFREVTPNSTPPIRIEMPERPVFEQRTPDLDWMSPPIRASPRAV